MVKKRTLKKLIKLIRDAKARALLESTTVDDEGL